MTRENEVFGTSSLAGAAGVSVPLVSCAGASVPAVAAVSGLTTAACSPAGAFVPAGGTGGGVGALPPQPVSGSVVRAAPSWRTCRLSTVVSPRRNQSIFYHLRGVVGSARRRAPSSPISASPLPARSPLTAASRRSRGDSREPGSTPSYGAEPTRTGRR